MLEEKIIISLHYITNPRMSQECRWFLECFKNAPIMFDIARMFQECFTMSSYLRAIYCCALSCSAACYFQELYNLLLRAFMQHSLLFSGTYRKIMFRHFATLIRQTERIHMKDGAAGATATQASH